MQLLLVFNPFFVLFFKRIRCEISPEPQTSRANSGEGEQSSDGTYPAEPPGTLGQVWAVASSAPRSAQH